MTPSSMRGMPVVFGRLLMVGSLVFLTISVVRHFDEIPRIETSTATAVALLLAVLASVLVNAIAALAWSWLVAAEPHNAGLAPHGEEATVVGGQGPRRIGYGLAFRIWAISNVAKYVPGNVFQYAGRLVLARRAGLPVSAVVVSMMLETLLVCAAPVLLLLIGFLTHTLEFDYVLQVADRGTQAEYAIAAAVILSSGAVVIYAFPNIRDQALASLLQVGLFRAAGAFGCYVTSFLIMGAAALVLLEAIWHAGGAIGWYELSCGYALAFLLGYIVPGAPGGIGIREIIMLGLFSAAIGAGATLGLAVLLRFASVAGDILGFAIACALRGEAA